MLYSVNLPQFITEAKPPAVKTEGKISRWRITVPSLLKERLHQNQGDIGINIEIFENSSHMLRHWWQVSQFAFKQVQLGKHFTVFTTKFIVTKRMWGSRLWITVVCSALWSLIIIIIHFCAAVCVCSHSCAFQLSLAGVAHVYLVSHSPHVDAVHEDDSSYLEIFMIACKYAILILKLFEYSKSEVFLITEHLFSECATLTLPSQTQRNNNKKPETANGLQSALRYILMVFSPLTHTHTD